MAKVIMQALPEIIAGREHRGTVRRAWWAGDHGIRADGDGAAIIVDDRAIALQRAGGRDIGVGSGDVARRWCPAK